jgi:predicted nucleic acid-binding protein
VTALAVDASVVVKWVFPHRDGEAHVGQALAVLEHIRQGRVSVLQPPHWLAEVAAVVSRLEPRRALEVINLLHAMEFPVSDGVEVYQRACELAVALRQHVFDTLYHAVALSRLDGVLLTEDEQYYHRAVRAGRVTLLSELPVAYSMLLEPEDIGLRAPRPARIGEHFQRYIEAGVRAILKPIPSLAW